jgi:hypothetical protein
MTPIMRQLLLKLVQALLDELTIEFEKASEQGIEVKVLV